MGSGRWDTDRYTSDTNTRASAGVDTFAYSKQAQITEKVHDSLKATRINDKPFGRLESRDSVDHPESLPILVSFDVTGSNITRAVEAQKHLPALMDLLVKYTNDPQVAIIANDDYETSKKNCIQASDFESDNRIDEAIRNTWLIGWGGGNNQESYDLVLYLAARKTVTDSMEIRGKKGYLFMYADEPFPRVARRTDINDTFGDTVEADIPIKDLIAETREKWNIFVMWPAKSSFKNAYNQYVELFGQDSVSVLEDPNGICEYIAQTVATQEAKVDPAKVKDEFKATATATAGSGSGAARL